MAWRAGGGTLSSVKRNWVLTVRPATQPTPTRHQPRRKRDARRVSFIDSEHVVRVVDATSSTPRSSRCPYPSPRARAPRAEATPSRPSATAHLRSSTMTSHHTFAAGFTAAKPSRAVVAQASSRLRAPRRFSTVRSTRPVLSLTSSSLNAPTRSVNSIGRCNTSTDQRFGILGGAEPTRAIQCRKRELS